MIFNRNNIDETEVINFEQVYAYTNSVTGLQKVHPHT